MASLLRKWVLSGNMPYGVLPSVFLTRSKSFFLFIWVYIICLLPLSRCYNGAAALWNLCCRRTALSKVIGKVVESWVFAFGAACGSLSVVCQMCTCERLWRLHWHQKNDECFGPVLKIMSCYLGIITNLLRTACYCYCLPRLVREAGSLSGTPLCCPWSSSWYFWLFVRVWKLGFRVSFISTD